MFCVLVKGFMNYKACYRANARFASFLFSPQVTQLPRAPESKTAFKYGSAHRIHEPSKRIQIISVVYCAHCAFLSVVWLCPNLPRSKCNCANESDKPKPEYNHTHKPVILFSFQVTRLFAVWHCSTQHPGIKELKPKSK